VYQYVTTVEADELWYLPEAITSLGVVREHVLHLVFAGSPGALSGGQWALILGASDQLTAHRIESLFEGDGEFTLTLSNAPAVDDVRLLLGGFTRVLHPKEHDRNLESVFDSSTSLPGRFELALEPLAAWPELLAPGRRVLVACGAQAVLTEVCAIDLEAWTLTVVPAIPAEDLAALSGLYPRYTTRIHANVVEADHGESQPPLILGSGDATQSAQRFMLDVDELAFVPDRSQSAGVRAAAEVTVEGRTWQQVDRLNDSGPTDAHYVVRMTETSAVEILFGDGSHGRRLPTGVDNVRVRYRVGVGPAGNLPREGLTELARTHPLIESVRQPLAAVGGNAMEDVASLRANAPASVLTLDRAVSLADFMHLATRHSSVWQARAFAVPTPYARREGVEVVIVPAGGGAASPLAKPLKDHLQRHALPGVAVSVRGYEALVLDLDVTLRIRTAELDPRQVVATVRAALMDAFSLRRRRLGEALYRSALSGIVEGVRGIENASCVIAESSLAVSPRSVTRGTDGAIKVIQPAEVQVAYLHAKRSRIEFTVQEYSL
jgi:hypothetical protein